MLQEQQFSLLLTDETTALQYLGDILKQEYQALLEGDIAVIENVTGKKNEALANQAQCMKSRKYFAAQCSADPSDTGMEQLIDSYSNSDDLTASFALLTSLARECHDANRTNGRLIAEKQQQALLALDILRQTKKTIPTYSVQGKADNTPSSKSLGKA
ncbi:MAG: flagellar biosynthesis/type III secretory pathway chaperone [Halioglobus sp.]|jgi:flagellar biosynthesis/type III secretory pathway chaperone